jgi:uroporphyrinogen decarboxylase
MEPAHRFLRACFGESVDRTPVWMMRQAGRYMPEYRAVRAKAGGFLELCKSPELAAEVTMQPIDAFGVDAAIIFSDILVPLEAMGMKLEFTDDGPHLPEPLRDRAAIDKLAIPDPWTSMRFVLEAIQRARKALGTRAPLIGFAGAPLTLAAYAVEGGGSTQYTELKKLLFSDRESAHALLEKLADTVSIFLQEQIRNGAQAVQIFDTWAGILSPRDFEEFALRHVKLLIASLKGLAPIIYFVNGCAPYLSMLKDCGADVIAVDWKVDLAAARAALGEKQVVMGNLDPAALFLPIEEIQTRTVEILKKGGPRGHIFNLGHGILPPTNVEHVRAMVETVKTYKHK